MNQEKLDLNYEMKYILNNCFHQTKGVANPTLLHSEIDTFKGSNGVYTFPYNFHFLKQSTSLELIRKIAVINAIYLRYFFVEDKVLDDYNLPINQFRQHIINLCEVHKFRLLSAGQFVHLCGEPILEYMLEYEGKYYEGVVFEKQDKGISVETMLDEANLCFIGLKFLPICVSFAAFCLLEDMIDKMKTCEHLITNFQIGRQLIDDLNDIEEDIHKPDRSYLINACQQSAGKDELTLQEVQEVLFSGDHDYRIAQVIAHVMQAAEEYAQKLNFSIFLEKIELYKNKSENYKRKS